jgi:hypothetical protein
LNAKRLVKPLVVKVDAPDPSALCGRIAELQRMGGGFVCIEGFCVSPGGHHFIVIDARRRPPIDVVAQSAGLLLAGFSECLDVRDRGFGDGGIAAAEIHVLHHIERAQRNSARTRVGKGQERVRIRGAIADRLERCLKVRHRCALVMGLIGSLVLPAFHDHEAVGTARFL